MDNINLPEFPKWPAMVVVGKPVTKEQAMEIIIRTTDFYFSTNDKTFEEELNEVLFGKKFRCIDQEYFQYNNMLKDLYSELSAVPDLYYLKNDRIVSCWIGGTKGWCNWNGNIFSNNYNIGKWPEADKVFKEWIKIAEAFPFLDLTCQIFAGETSEDEGRNALVEYVVKDGKCEMIYPPTKTTVYPQMTNFSLHNERGCTIEQFREAINYVKQKVKNE